MVSAQLLTNNFLSLRSVKGFIYLIFQSDVRAIGRHTFIAYQDVGVEVYTLVASQARADRDQRAYCRLLLLT